MSRAGSSKPLPKQQPYLDDPPANASTHLFAARDARNLGTFTPTEPSTPRSASPATELPQPAAAPPKGNWLRRAQTTATIAEEAGVRWPWLMYISYYIPCIAWARHYEWRFLLGDVVAGITMASFYIPMALSLSANLAHLQPIHGLYSFAIQPLFYAMLGSCPTMAVGPEAAGSLLMGSAIRVINQHHTPAFDDGEGEGDAYQNARLAGLITVMTGGFAFIAGILRLGFLDSVLSKPLLRGFISGVGVVIFVDQLLPEMGLIKLAKKEHMTHASTVEKLIWLFKNFQHTHLLTFAVASISFTIIILGRSLKHRLSRRAPWIVFLPDRFFVVVLSAILCGYLRWDHHGLEVLGDVSSDGGTPPFSFFSPIDFAHLNHAKEATSTAFLIAVLGFFESVVAAKSLGTTTEVTVSSNRELIALGAANMAGGCFQALPAFGGYGRSKVNQATGGRTPVSSVVLSLCTILCTLFLLPYFYFLPRAVLCAMISVVGISLLEEAPADITFFLRIGAYTDLTTLALVFFTTLFWSLTTGMAIGVGISLIQVIRHSTRARIQILGRDPVSGVWHPVDEDPDRERLEQPPNTLVIKIREALTFANAGDLQRRLWRIDRYGDSRAHPSLPRMKHGVNGVVFDVAGVEWMDGSGAQTLVSMVGMYVDRDVDVWFCRVVGGERGGMWKRMERCGVVGMVGGKERFVGSVQEALERHEKIVAEREAGEA